MQVTGYTTVCMSIANPNHGTPSPGMHNAGFEALNLDFVYVAFEPENVATAISAIRALGIRGCSISKPFKQEAVQLVDHLDPIAAEIGAINTIVNDMGVLTGYNSDWIGCVASLESLVDVAGLKVALLGAGGAAAAAAFGLKRAGADVTIFNRTLERGSELATAQGVAFGGSLEDLASAGPFDVVVNATSIGRSDSDPAPVQLDAVEGVSVVMDMTFTTPATALLDQAKSLGLEIIHGIDMLVTQGAFQFELFTGQAAPRAAMRRRLESQLFT